MARSVHQNSKRPSEKQNKLALVGLSLLIGGFLSSFLLRFLFGDRIYSQQGWKLLAPSSYIPVIGRVGTVERLISMTIDAVVLGIVIYIIIYFVVRFPKQLKHP